MTIVKMKSTHKIEQRQFKEGEIVEIPQKVLNVNFLPEWYDVIQPEMPKKEHTGTKDSVADDEGEDFDMENVHAYEGLIMETDKSYKIKLLSAKGKKYHSISDDGKREWDRYQLPIEYDGEETIIRLPPSVVETMYQQASKGKVVPIDKHQPVFLLSKTGEGVKTKYSVNLVE